MTASIVALGDADDCAEVRSASSASWRCASPACEPAQTPAMPSCTVDGVFGIARTTGTPAARCLSMAAVGIAAAIESTVCSVARMPPISRSSAVDVLRLDRDHDQRRARAASTFDERRAYAIALA